MTYRKHRHYPSITITLTLRAVIEHLPFLKFVNMHGHQLMSKFGLNMGQLNSLITKPFLNKSVTQGFSTAKAKLEHIMTFKIVIKKGNSLSLKHFLIILHPLLILFCNFIITILNHLDNNLLLHLLK